MNIYDHYCELLNLISPFNPSFIKLSKLPAHRKLTTNEIELLSTTPVSPLALSLAIMKHIWGDLRALRVPSKLSSLLNDYKLSSKDISALIHLIYNDSLIKLLPEEKWEILCFLYQNLKTDRFLNPFLRAKLSIISQSTIDVYYLTKEE